MRLAIYFLPRQNAALWRFGCAFLGYDSITGALCEQTRLPGLTVKQIEKWTAEPRRYGFHATLKAPFRLADGVDTSAVLAAAAEFSALEMPVSPGAIAARSLGNFIALAPLRQVDALNAFATRCVQHFDPFRAPMKEAERSRRLKSNLTPRQIELMDRWGYPYVHEEFRFHMSLTGPLPLDVRAPMLAAIEERYAPISAAVIIDSICVCEQTSPQSHFRLLQRIELCGGAAPSAASTQ